MNYDRPILSPKWGLLPSMFLSFCLYAKTDIELNQSKLAICDFKIMYSHLLRTINTYRL